jgi:hypothetical protein
MNWLNSSSISGTLIIGVHYLALQGVETVKAAGRLLMSLSDIQQIGLFVSTQSLFIYPLKWNHSFCAEKRSGSYKQLTL